MNFWIVLQQSAVEPPVSFFNNLGYEQNCHSKITSIFDIITNGPTMDEPMDLCRNSSCGAYPSLPMCITHWCNLKTGDIPARLKAESVPYVGRTATYVSLIPQ